MRLNQGTLSVWASLGATSSSYSPLVRVNGGDDLHIYRQEDGRFIVCYNGIRLGESTIPITDNGWHLYTMTWQHGEQTLYIDGMPILSGNVNASLASTQLCSIGWSSDDGENGYWIGSLANLMTFDRPLTSREIAALYAMGPP